MILQITVRFLDNRFHGQVGANQPEWPPSPMRLCQSMLAGAKRNWSPEHEKFFLWLESLAPPLIRAPGASAVKPVCTYVPNNDFRAEKTEKIIRAQVIDTPFPEIDYIWQFKDEDAPLAGRAVEIARHISVLGWGIDMAIGYAKIVSQVQERPSEFKTYEPGGSKYGVRLRTLTKGSLESLEREYSYFSQRIRRVGNREFIEDLRSNPRFSVTTYNSSPDIYRDQRRYCAFRLEKQDEPGKLYAFEASQLKVLVGMIRSLLHSNDVRAAVEKLNLRREGCEKINFSQFIAGHPKNHAGPRLSIMPISSIGHPKADAFFRRVVLAEPFESDGVVCQLLSKILDQRSLNPYSSEDTAPVLLKAVDPHDENIISRHYVGPAKEWASISPVVLPGYDSRTDNRKGSAKRLSGAKQIDRALSLIKKSLAHAGIVQECQIELSPLSWWPGVPHACGFVPRAKLGTCPRYHVKLTFAEEFLGPLSLGRQRHTGFGVFAAM